MTGNVSRKERKGEAGKEERGGGVERPVHPTGSSQGEGRGRKDNWNRTAVAGSRSTKSQLSL